MGLGLFLSNLGCDLYCLKEHIGTAANQLGSDIRYGMYEAQSKVDETVFSGKLKKEALQEHDKKLNAYNEIYDEMNKNCESLYKTRKDSINLILYIEKIINTIANSPKEFNVKLGEINVELQDFKKTENYIEEIFYESEKAKRNVVGGVAAGVGVATMAPTALMSIATTFGTASTGTAISALSGAAAKKAAVAWIGRTFASTAVKSGAGMLAGEAFLALAGPVGWGITAATASFSLLSLAKQNKEIAEQALEETKEIAEATLMLKNVNESIYSLLQMTVKLYEDMFNAMPKLIGYLNADFLSLQDDEQKYLGTVVNNTTTLATLLNKSL